MSDTSVDTKRSRSRSDRYVDCMTDFYQCVGDSLCTAWYCIKANTLNAWTWISGNCAKMGNCGKVGSDGKSRKSLKRATQVQRDSLASLKDVSQLSIKTTESLQQKKLKTKLPSQSAIDQQPTSSNVSDKSSFQGTTTSSHPNQNRDHHHQQQHHHRHHHHEAPSGTNTVSKEKRVYASSPPSPPKIDFVETGSIFGNRKKHSVPNLQMLDDGRFRSPGQPEVINAPGGRTIRISFQTGFPSVKSIESRHGITNVKTVSSKKSLDPTDLNVETIKSNPNESNPGADE